jgi:hypothetical protein
MAIVAFDKSAQRMASRWESQIPPSDEFSRSLGR